MRWGPTTCQWIFSHPATRNIKLHSEYIPEFCSRAKVGRAMGGGGISGGEIVGRGLGSDLWFLAPGVWEEFLAILSPSVWLKLVVLGNCWGGVSDPWFRRPGVWEQFFAIRWPSVWLKIVVLGIVGGRSSGVFRCMVSVVELAWDWDGATAGIGDMGLGSWWDWYGAVEFR